MPLCELRDFPVDGNNGVQTEGQKWKNLNLFSPQLTPLYLKHVDTDL